MVVHWQLQEEERSVCFFACGLECAIIDWIFIVNDSRILGELYSVGYSIILSVFASMPRFDIVFLNLDITGRAVWSLLDKFVVVSHCALATLSATCSLFYFFQHCFSDHV